MEKINFYDKADSCYLRIQYLTEQDSFRIVMRNEALLSKEVESTKGIMVGALVRGILELAYQNPAYIHDLGKEMGDRDLMIAASENLTEDQREAWIKEPQSKGIH